VEPLFLVVMAIVQPSPCEGESWVGVNLQGIWLFVEIHPPRSSLSGRGECLRLTF
jgi:hypothetical protein